MACYDYPVEPSQWGRSPALRKEGKRIMKHLSRKLLSLLMALAIVCTMVPAALASTMMSGTISNGTYTLNLTRTYPSGDYYVSIPNYSSATFGVNYSLTNSATGVQVVENPTYVTYDWKLSRTDNMSTPVSYGTSSTCTVQGTNLAYYNNTGYWDTNYYGYAYILSCTVTATTATGIVLSTAIDWSINGNYNNNYNYGSINPSVTVYDTNPGYGLGDTDDVGNRSIISQIEGALPSGCTLRYVTFQNTTHTNGNLNASTYTSYYDNYSYNYGTGYNSLSSVVFTPSTYNGTATFGFTAYASYYNNADQTFYGTMSFKVEEGTSGAAIAYSGKTGDTIYFDSADFQNFWSGIYSRGTLSYVRFTSVSSGTLYGDHSGASRITVGPASSATSCYASPSSSQNSLSSVAYVPSGSAKSVTIRFTAYGSTSGSGSNTTRSGVVNIAYVDSTASPINYEATAGTSISLSGGDFTDMYRSVVGSSASTVNIKLRSVPTNGALYYQSRALTSSNIGEYTFSSNTRGSYRISDISYTPGSSGATDTVEYACYNGGTLRFIGTITFTSTPAVVNNLVINYSCGKDGVTFNYMDFFGSGAAMASSSYLMFGTPSSGGLYVNDAPVNSATQFAFYTSPGSGYQSLNSLVYKPAAGFNGTATISFTAFNLNHTMAANGTVNISVTQPATTTPTTPTTPGTTTPGAFKDTPANAWYADAVAALVKSGVISGYDDGTFRPKNKVTYGEALKMIMRAAGYSAQPEGSGADWAINYKTVAVTDGLVGEEIVLSSAIDRNTVAAIAAKALHLTPVTEGASPFVDSNDGYARALYQANIITGDASSGSNYYKGGDTITRAEISAVIYRINNYKGAVNNTPDTNVPGWLQS